MKRLSEAIGYLELQMPRHAADCLKGLDDAGPLTAAVEIIRGEAARRESRFDDAAEAFEHAARILPENPGKFVWLLLSRLYFETGDTRRATETLARARGASPPPQTRPDSN
ncbi:MAG TPA: tetratricopeptide repeat protein [Thermoguttaceae bacterium]|nr:tetratricopeptide repeat protein [Thermoguttaceae bacterium]